MYSWLWYRTYSASNQSHHIGVKNETKVRVYPRPSPSFPSPLMFLTAKAVKEGTSEGLLTLLLLRTVALKRIYCPLVSLPGSAIRSCLGLSVTSCLLNCLTRPSRYSGWQVGLTKCVLWSNPKVRKSICCPRWILLLSAASTRPCPRPCFGALDRSSEPLRWAATQSVTVTT